MLRYPQSRKSLSQSFEKRTKCKMNITRCPIAIFVDVSVFVLTADQRVSLAFPTIAVMVFLPALLMSQPLQARLICLLSISSLMCTAYILIFIPNATPEPANRKQAMHISQSTARPIHQYISYLNGGLSILILLNAFSFKNKQGVHEGFWLLCIIPSGERKLRARQRSC